MKRPSLVVLSLIAASLFAVPNLFAEAQLREVQGKIEDIDHLISSVWVQDKTGRTLFTVPDEALVRERLTRRRYEDLRPGDLVAVRFWEDTHRVDRIEILGHDSGGTAVAEQTAVADQSTQKDPS